MKKFIKIAIAMLSIALLMFAEYRYIMRNLEPRINENGNISIEMFGQIDEYDCNGKDHIIARYLEENEQ